LCFWWMRNGRARLAYGIAEHIELDVAAGHIG
jgi:hypothetical protein